MQKKRMRKVKKRQRQTSPVAPSVRPLEEVYRSLRQGLRGKTMGKRILNDLTADLDNYKDEREPNMPGTTIRNGFKAYPWRPTPFNTVKG
ncbi:hypothetical protein [Rhizobium laguerreae]|uniref:hypothetical protein n=1 Tax=Rhizobium laguerreae TaxID=1076926 RepID=UPI001C8FF429|nr:hypothetical protein [Rhizobium laguerreae]MBY3317287.1 hypothetical protein [Rhizobium laguerreae]